MTIPFLSNIFVGDFPNDGKGEALRNAFIKTDTNFDVIYNYLINTGKVFTYFDHGVNVDNTMIVLKDLRVLGNITVLGNTVVENTYINVDKIVTEDTILVKNTSNTINVATGALVVRGGVGIAKDVRVGGNIYAPYFVGDVVGTVSSLSNHDTNDLVEGPTNFYFTTSRARGSISAVQTGGDGSVTYSGDTGVLTYTGPNAANVRSYLTAGTGLTYTGSTGEFKIANTSVTAATYGGDGTIPVITVNAQGQLTNVLNVSIPAQVNSDWNATSGVAAILNKPALPAAIPTGGIILWSGSTDTVPSGWHICDGTNGTPDLRDRFVVGAGNSYTVGATGGSKDAVVVSHTHSVTDPGHVHQSQYDWRTPGSIDSNGAGSEIGGMGTTYNYPTTSASTGISISSAGASGTNANLPPYYALAYIMKL